jgi:hypothetical protein
MSEWHYAKDNQQLGPVTSAQLRQLAGSGQIHPTDMVWKDGMPDWVPAGKIKGLFATNAATRPSAAVATATATLPQPAAHQPDAYDVQPAQDTFPAAQQPAAASIAYYNPSQGLSERVAKTLKGFPPATGYQGEWPLSEMHLAQLKEAEKQRKALRGFNSLCQLGVLVCAFITLGSVIGFLGALAGPGSTRILRGESIAFIGGSLAGSLGLTVLCYLSGRAALKCRIWGPITIGSLITIGLLWILASFFLASSLGPNTRPELMLIAVLIVLLFFGALLYVCIRALIAIPKFLAAPVWAQEALVNAKL